MCDRPASYVYFLRPIGADGPVKVGYSQRPEHRCAQIREWNGQTLELVAVYPGGCKIEARFHALLRDHHLEGEWFSACDDLTALINTINAGTFDPGVLPARGERVPTRVREYRWSDAHRAAFNATTAERRRSRAQA